eukprot:2675155-Prymnesium_polylepis.1
MTYRPRGPYTLDRQPTADRRAHEYHAVRAPPQACTPCRWAGGARRGCEPRHPARAHRPRQGG